MNPDNNNSSKNPSDESKQSSLDKTACGGPLDHPGNFPGAMNRGERVYFCTIACWQAFTRNPDLFMVGEIEHPIDSI